MAEREQKQNSRLSLSLSLLSPKKKSAMPSRSLYISKPLNSYGPSGTNLGIHTDDTFPLRVYTEIFGPSLHYKSVGVNRNTSATDVIENIIQKMSMVGNEESYSPSEFCLVEMCVLPEFSYFRLLRESTSPLYFCQLHSKRYTNTDTWRLKLILKTQLKSTADLILHSSKRDPSLIGVAVECNCLEDTFLSVYFHLPGYTTCGKIINKIISEFAYDRQPDDFALFCSSIHTTARDPLPDGLNLAFILNQSKTQILELALRFRYDDYGEDCDLTDTEEPVSSPETCNEQTPKHSEVVDDTEDTWIEFYDPARERIYYVNSKTEEITWVHPTTQQEMNLDSDMPPGWVRGVDKETGRVYYRNTFDKKTEWSHPLRHLERIYQRSLQPIATMSLPCRQTVTPPLHKPPSRTPPPVPRSARPSLPPAELNQIKTESQSNSLHSSNQSFPDMERASSDALLSEFLSVSRKDKTHIKKNKRLSHLRRLLINEKDPQDSDSLSIGSGHRLKSLFATAKKHTTSTPLLDVIARVTPNQSPAARKKSTVSVSSNVSEKSLSGKLPSLPRNFGGESSGTENQSNVTGESFVRSVSEQDHTQSAVTALNEAFSLLDSVGRGVEEVYENKNAQLEERERESENSPNNCFQIIDSSFDECSDQEMMDYPVVVVDTDKLLDSVDNSEHLEVFSPAKEGDAIFDTEFNKVSSYEHKGYEENNLRSTNMSSLVGEGDECLDSSELIQRPASVCSFSSGDLGSQKSEDGSTSGRSRSRTRKERMSRNTSALNHKELEQLNKGIEPVQKSILKHSKSDVEDDNNNNNNRKVKGVTFLSSAVQMIEIERRRDSESSDTPSLDTQSIIHKRGAGNWRNMLKTFYDEVDSEKGDGNLVWSPDEGIGLVEEEKFIHEANKLTREQELPHIMTEQNGEELIYSLKRSLTSNTPPDLLEPTHAPLLPPRPAPEDLVASVTSSPSLPDSEGSLPPSTPKHSDTSDVTNKPTESTRQVYTSFSDSFKDSASTADNSGVTDSGMFSLELSTNLDLSPRKEDLSQSLTQLVFDTLSGTLANSTTATEPFPRSEQTTDTDEPIVVSSLVVPITPNTMIPMDVFLPKERPSLPREQLVPRSLSKEEIPSPIDQLPSPIPHSPSGPSKHFQTLSQARPASPVLVDQLNKPLSGTPFIYGYQYQRKPADKSTTLHSGYLALVNQQSELESKQKMKQTN